MTITKELFVVRHGETTWNHQGLLQGHTDVSLSTLGHAQAFLVARRFADLDVDAVYASPLSRAHATARRIARFHTGPLIVDERLTERAYGPFEGVRRKTIESKYPSFFHTDNDYVFDGVESFASVKGRARSFLADLEQTPFRRVVAVTHGGWLNAVAALLSPETYQPQSYCNASVSTLTFTTGKWSIVKQNDMSHLSDFASRTASDRLF